MVWNDRLLHGATPERSVIKALSPVRAMLILSPMLHGVGLNRQSELAYQE
jgi:hypothetical protein